MKTFLISLLFLFFTFTVKSQIITVNVKKWIITEFPHEISFGDAISDSSVTIIDSDEGKLTLTFNLDKKILKTRDNKGFNSFYNIKDIYPSSEAVLNVDAEQDGYTYNFVLDENMDNEMNLVIQRFNFENDKRIGIICYLVNYDIN